VSTATRHALSLLLGALVWLAACDPFGPADYTRTDEASVAATSGTAPWAASGEKLHLRVVAANLTSGDHQTYEAPGTRILQALHPDVALLQEFRYGDNTAADLRTFVDDAFGTEYVYHRGDGEALPNGIVTHLPVLEAGTWRDPKTATRTFLWARLDVPGDRDLWAVSLHLLTSSTTARKAEAVALVAEVREHVPESDLLVIGGDLNTGSRVETCLTTLGGIVSTAAPYPVDQNGNNRTNSSRTKPYDWVLPDPDLASLEVAVTVGASVFPDGLVVDSRVYQPLEELAPVEATDSSATNMQHMAVVKDFEVVP